MDYFPDQLKDLMNEAWHQVTVLFECTYNDDLSCTEKLFEINKP